MKEEMFRDDYDVYGAEIKNDKKKITSLVFIALITISMFVIFIYSYYNRDKDRPTQQELKSINLVARERINEPRKVNNVLSEVDKEDYSNFLLVSGSNVEMQNADINKDGDSSDVKKSREVGMNSAIVTSFGGKLNLYYSNINTNGIGSNGIYVTGRNALGNINDTDIRTSAPSSSGLVVSNNGSIEANHLGIYTKAKNSPCIDSLNKESSMKIVNTMFESNGSLSPLVNTSGQVTIEKSTGNAYTSPIAVMYKSGNVYFQESTFIAAGAVPEGFTETGILIYGEDKDEEQFFTSINSSLNIDKNKLYYNTASLFNIQDTKAVLSLSNTTYNIGSGVLAYIKNSNVVLNTSNQRLEGNIIMDNNSSLEISLKYNSSYDMNLNNDNIKVNLGINSRIKLLGDTYIGGFINEDATNSNVDLNGYHLYVGGVEFIK